MIKFKLCTLAFLLSLSFTAHPKVIEISSVLSTKLDGAFQLLNDSGVEAVLDCASFVHNMNIHDGEVSHLFYISHNECINDYDYLRHLPQKKRCLHFSERAYFLDDCQ